MGEWLERYQIPIAVGLIVFIALGGIMLLYEQQRDKLALAEKAPAVEASKLEEENEALQSKVSELENRMKELETKPVVVSEASSSQAPVEQVTSLLVNINIANEAQLDTLPGIGPAKAQDIINYRQTHGGFKNITELKEVKGIGDATFEKLKSLVTI